MADITFPGSFPFSDGNTLSGPDTYELFYNVLNPNQSLGEINGRLTEVNLAASFDLEDIHTQRGSIVDGWSSAGTANLDWKKSLFGNRAITLNNEILFSLNAVDPTFFIPGLNRTFYLPRASYLLVYWCVHMSTASSDLAASNDVAQVYLHLDGTTIPDSVRCIPFSSAAWGGVAQYAAWQTFAKGRTWCGHLMSPSGSSVAAGWHTIGLKLIADSDPLMTRIHACHIIVTRWNA